MLNQIPFESLPDGTVLRTTAYWNGVPVTHYGIMRREWNGQIVIDHNSKKIGHAAATDPAAFADGSLMFIDSVPPTLGDGWQIAARGRADAERGVPWTVDNNCEDILSNLLDDCTEA
jgi:hypothetical protein